MLRGWKEFHFDDEPYWNNYFGKDGPAQNVTLLVSTVLPPEAPKKETIGWAVQRADGGRGVGLVIPHYFRNWNDAPRSDHVRTGLGRPQTVRRIAGIPRPLEDGCTHDAHHAVSYGSIRLVDARYQGFFEAAGEEIRSGSSGTNYLTTEGTGVARFASRSTDSTQSRK